MSDDDKRRSYSGHVWGTAGTTGHAHTSALLRPFDTRGGILASAGLALLAEQYGHVVPMTQSEALAMFGRDGPLGALAYVEGRGLGWMVFDGGGHLVVRLNGGATIGWKARGVWTLAVPR